MNIIDVHTHAFPDFLAERAITKLSQTSKEYKPLLNGTISDLLSSMDQNLIKSAFIANIATKPEQSSAALKWSLEIKSERIIPLGTIHHSSDNWESELDNIKNSNLKGVKLHPFHQNFLMDSKDVYPIYEKIQSLDLFILFHSGYDVSYGDMDNALSFRMKKIIENFPSLKIISSHFGGWREWDEAYQNLCGKDIFFETSFISEVGTELIKKFFNKHDSNRFFFGSDSPWLSQKDQISFVSSLKISDEFKEKIFYKNILNSNLI